MQDANHEATYDGMLTYSGIIIQPKDILTIVVTSKNFDLALDFNLPVMSYQAGSTSSTSSYSSRVLGYLVDMDGNIDYPVFGKLKVAGLTREQLSEMIKQKLIQENIIKDAIVTTEFMNFKISVMGEVRSPGSFNIGDDRITILEALAKAGDMTLYGKRDNVLVTREINGKIQHYRVNLLSTELIYSPVYYLQQNDVVYVSPNNTIAARSRINENRSVGVGISLVNFMTNMALLIYSIW